MLTVQRPKKKETKLEAILIGLKAGIIVSAGIYLITFFVIGLATLKI